MFQNNVLGLLYNKALDMVAALICISGIIMDKLNIGSRPVKSSSGDGKVENVSIFIVPTAPKRAGAMAKYSQSSSHTLSKSLVSIYSTSCSREEVSRLAVRDCK